MRNASIWRRSSVLMVFLGLTTVCASAQGVSNASNTGVPENAVLHGSDIDNVQLNNGSLHIDIPIWSYKGRGLDNWARFIYDSHGWYIMTTCSMQGVCTDHPAPETHN